MSTQLNRAILGLPIVAFSALMLRAFLMAPPITDFMTNILEAGVFKAHGQAVPMLRRFYNVPIVDEVFSQIVPAFAQLQFFTDPVAYWQTLVFLTDHAALYAILLFESNKPEVRSGFRYPSVIAFLGQLASAGLVFPIYLYAQYVLQVPTKAKQATKAPKAQSTTNALYDFAILPSILIGYFVPTLSCYLHPTLQGRHWWSWIWQLYPVWYALSAFIFVKLLNQTVLKSWANNNRTTLRLITVVAIALVSVAVNVRVALQSGFSQMDLFYPYYFIDSPSDGAIALRTLIQYDQLCSQGAAVFWLAYQLSSLEAVPKFFMLPALCIVTAVFAYGWGIGIVLLVGWSIREFIIAADQPKSKSS